MDNFKDTAYRMYEDVEVLQKNSRWFNCCYLSGYVVECYCKLVLDNAITNGIAIRKSSVRAYSHNVNDMEIDLRNISISNNILSQYCLDLNIVCNNILNNWNPLNRYNNSTSDWNKEENAEKYKNEIESVLEQIISMELDGVI